MVSQCPRQRDGLGHLGLAVALFPGDEGAGSSRLALGQIRPHFAHGLLAGQFLRLPRCLDAFVPTHNGHPLHFYASIIT